MIVQIQKLAHRGLLRGRPQGRIHFAELCGLLSEAIAGEVVFLDFKGIKAVNGSWLNAAIGELFRWAAEERNNVFPLLTNFPTSDLDELELVAQVNDQAYPVTDGLESSPPQLVFAWYPVPLMTGASPGLSATRD